MGKLNKLNSHHTAPPTKKVEIKMPSVDRTMIGQRSFLSFAASIWMGPANSRKLSIKFISTSRKSMELANCTALSDNTDLALPSNTSSKEHTSDSTIMPMVGGH